MNKILLLSFLLLSLTNVWGQGGKCGTEELLREYHRQNPQTTKPYFRAAFRVLPDSVIIIPTVVHIMHGVSDSVVGRRSNLSKKQ
ncbi:MAG: hypothetical protein ACOVOL_05405, partial [Bacteroidia bacterium]